MSFLEDSERYGDALVRMVDSGVPVAAACRRVTESKEISREVQR